MEELSIYNLTITSDHRLKVNNEEVGGDGSILPGDSESLLAWALVQVGYIQQDSDSNMALQIEDQRPDGYGVQKVTIPPGKKVLIEALRTRTGRDLSYITEQVHRQAEAEQEAQEAPSGTPAPVAEEEQWDESWEEAPTQEDSSVAQDAPENAWEQEVRQEVEEGPQDDSPVLAPPPPLAGTPDTPAQVPDPPARRTRERAYEQRLPEPPQPETERFPEGWGEFDDLAHEEPVQETPVQEQDEAMPPLPQFSPEPAVTEHESLAAEQVTYKRNRPELGEDEAKKAEPKKKKPKSKVLIAALVVVSLVAVFLAVQVIRSQAENSYVATCIDERTMVRQASIEGCENEEASYYRWWYTPRGSEVPAVNQTVAQDQGTRIRPEEALIREDFAPEGGLYGGEEDEG